MYSNKLCIYLILASLQFLFNGCSHHEDEQTVSAEQFLQVPLAGCGYTITVPSGWREVVKEADVKKLVFWSFSNNNYTKHTEEPLFRAWNAPEDTNAFLTVMEVKRHRNYGMGSFYDQTIRFMREMGWVIHETGITKIGGERSKWWIQSHAGGEIQQQCFMVTNGAYIYILAFTTSYLSEDKQKHFSEIAHTVTFYEGM